MGTSAAVTYAEAQHGFLQSQLGKKHTYGYRGWVTGKALPRLRSWVQVVNASLNERLVQLEMKHL